MDDVNTFFFVPFLIIAALIMVNAALLMFKSTYSLVEDRSYSKRGAPSLCMIIIGFCLALACLLTAAWCGYLAYIELT